jgi:hypothetical protein
MKSSIPDPSLIRQYLLGRLDANKELENEVSEGIVFNDDVSEMADSIEDEIIEEYLEGALDSADKAAVDGYFLRPGERMEKLRFIRLLQHHFETTQDDLSPSQSDVLFARARFPKDRAGVRPGDFWRTRFTTYAQLAALLLLCILSLSYISRLRNRQGGLESDLAREREQSAELATEVSQLQPPIVSLTLVSDRSRDTAAQVPRIQIKPSTQRIFVEIALPNGETASYDVHLERKSARTSIWTATLLPITSPSGDARLVFDIPAQGIESDIYSFVVSSSPPTTGWQKYYDFEAKVTK